jgi:hypothetical protein
VTSTIIATAAGSTAFAGIWAYIIHMLRKPAPYCAPQDMA